MVLEAMGTCIQPWNNKAVGIFDFQRSIAVSAYCCFGLKAF